MNAIREQRTAISPRFRLGWFLWAGGFALALGLRHLIPPWALMWLIALMLFFGFKIWTWKEALADGVKTTQHRELAYLFLWTGMNARNFLAREPRKITASSYNYAGPMVKILTGVISTWVVARVFGTGLIAGWMGMIGLVLILHFGTFALLAKFWSAHGVAAPPLMNRPLAADSLNDFWGRRWNSGFHDIVFGLFFVPFTRRFGMRVAVLGTFLISGLIHETVLTFPARGGYGLPTLYFTLQGLGVLAEHSNLGKRFGLGRNLTGRFFTLGVVVLPVFSLFPPPFIFRVMIPFLKVIHALP